MIENYNYASCYTLKPFEDSSKLIHPPFKVYSKWILLSHAHQSIIYVPRAWRHRLAFLLLTLKQGRLTCTANSSGVHSKRSADKTNGGLLLLRNCSHVAVSATAKQAFCFMFASGGMVRDKLHVSKRRSM